MNNAGVKNPKKKQETKKEKWKNGNKGKKRFKQSSKIVRKG